MPDTAAENGGAVDNVPGAAAAPLASTQRAKAGGDHKLVRTDHRTQSIKAALHHASESQRVALTGVPPLPAVLSYLPGASVLRTVS